MSEGPFSRPPGLENLQLLFVTEHGVRLWVNDKTGDFKFFGIDTVGIEGARYVKDLMGYITGRGERPNVEDYSEPHLSEEDIRDLMVQDYDALVEMNNK